MVICSFSSGFRRLTHSLASEPVLIILGNVTMNNLQEEKVCDYVTLRYKSIQTHMKGHSNTDYIKKGSNTYGSEVPWQRQSNKTQVINIPLLSDTRKKAIIKGCVDCLSIKHCIF